MSLLSTYVAAWRDAADRVLELFADLGYDDLAVLTDCPGWTVRDVVAHLAAIESDLAGAGAVDVDAVSPGEVVSAYTQRGISDRAGRSRDELLTELREAVAIRAERLESDPPADPLVRADTGPLRLDWTWETLLRNRVIDVWVHEQDVRRAVGRPGAMDAPAAHVTTHTFAAAVPYVVGKKVGAAPGSTIVVEITGPVATTVGVRMNQSGRAERVDPADDPDVRLTLDTEAFTVLGAGRRPVDDVSVQICGDAELGRRVLEQLAVTP